MHQKWLSAMKGKNLVDSQTDYNELVEGGGFMKDASHYLVFAKACRWDGSSGYTIAGDQFRALERSYDVNLTVKNITNGGKALLLLESSHDVPMGNNTVIVALTDDEYRKLANASFCAVEKFADQYFRALV